MRLLVAAVGRLKVGAERELAEHYRDRAAKAGRNIGISEIEIVELKESRAPGVHKRLIEEAIALANVIPDRAVTVVLDEHGENVDSASLAGELRAWRDTGRHVAFIIGGPDGLGDEIKRRGDLTLAFGAATWPHQLVRIMLIEQLYRAVTILAGHPYHRG